MTIFDGTVPLLSTQSYVDSPRFLSLIGRSCISGDICQKFEASPRGRCAGIVLPRLAPTDINVVYGWTSGTYHSALPGPTGPINPVARDILRLTVVQLIINSHFVSHANNVAAYRTALNVYAQAEHMPLWSFIVSESMHAGASVPA